MTKIKTRKTHILGSKTNTQKSTQIDFLYENWFDKRNFI